MIQKRVQAKQQVKTGTAGYKEYGCLVAPHCHVANLEVLKFGFALGSNENPFRHLSPQTGDSPSWSDAVNVATVG